MPYFAAVLAHTPSGWSASEVELTDVEDVDGVIDAVRSVDDEVDTSLLFVEENDEWFAVVRVDEDGDPRIFVSDGRAVDTSAIAALLVEAAEVVELPEHEDDDEGAVDDDDDDDEASRIAGDPVGDADLLADLGTPAVTLLALCAEEGQLPADIISALCERAGCLEVLDSLRVT